MGKTVSATDLLNAGRRDRAGESPDPTPTRRLDDQASKPPGFQTARELDDQTASGLVIQTPEQLDAETARRLDVQATSHLVAAPRYQKATVFLRPDQRRWTKDTVRGLPVEGLSASDIVRLALDRLRRDIEGGLPLVDVLTSQAHAEAATMTGRRNRGLPPSTDTGGR